MGTPDREKQQTNIARLLSTLEARGEMDADQLESATGIRKAIVISTLFLARRRGQCDARPKPDPEVAEHEFRKEDADCCKRLSRCGWHVREIADRLGATEQYVETMLSVAAAPKRVRELIEQGAVNPAEAVEVLDGRNEEDALHRLRDMARRSASCREKVRRRGLVYRFLSHVGIDLYQEEIDWHPKPDLAADIADFFTGNVKATLALYDTRCPRRVVSLDNFRGGEPRRPSARVSMYSPSRFAPARHTG